MDLAGVPSPGFLQLKGLGLQRQPASRLRAWGRPTDSLNLQGNSAVVLGSSRDTPTYTPESDPNAFLAGRGRCPRKPALSGEARKHAEPAEGRAGRQSGKHRRALP